VDAAKVMERAVKQLLRFHCRHHFDREVDDLAHEHGWLNESQSHARASLGTLLELVSRLDDLLDKGELTEPGRRYRLLFGNRRLSAPGTLAQHRNVCAHERAGDAPATPERIDGAALAFFDEAERWLEHLGSGTHPLFPQVVQIREERVDVWGRRTFHATNDRGGEDKIHAESPKVVGECYFMHPLSNPVRVFPVLVEAEERLPSRPSARA
jgi:hypothetical protein